MRRGAAFLAAAWPALVVVGLVGRGPSGLAAQERPVGEAADVEREAQRERQGAGLRVGVWRVEGLREVEGARYGESPAFEGYFQKGLDLHLVVESSIGLWRRSQRIERAGSFGSVTREEVNSYVVPLLTAIKFYPFTRPEHAFEPFVAAGIGFAVGIDDRTTSGSDLLGLGAGSGTALLTGFGFKGGAGFEWRLGRVFGVSAGGRYQWIKFSGEVGGERLFRGLGAEAGLTYRFQYR